MTEALSSQDQRRGEHLMERARLWTALRADMSPLLGIAVALADGSLVESLATTAGTVGLIYTDYQDGQDARNGAELLGIETTIEGALADPAADKDLVNSLYLGLFARYLRRKNIAAATVVGANYLTSRWRDRKMEENRTLALSHDIDPKAILINKAKTALQLGAELALVSPAEKNPKYRKIGLAAMSLGSVLGIAGEQIFRHRVNKAISAKQKGLVDTCPYTVPGPSS